MHGCCERGQAARAVLMPRLCRMAAGPLDFLCPSSHLPLDPARLLAPVDGRPDNDPVLSAPRPVPRPDRRQPIGSSVVLAEIRNIAAPACPTCDPPHRRRPPDHASGGDRCQDAPDRARADVSERLIRPLVLRAGGPARRCFGQGCREFPAAAAAIERQVGFLRPPTRRRRRVFAVDRARGSISAERG
jgi:hypothetical protein